LESHAYWQPPVYFLALVPAIEIGGYNLTTLRVCSVLIGGGLVILVFVLGLRFTNALTAKVAALILACDPHFVNNVKFARMDGLCMLFMLIALAVYLKPLFENRSANGLITGVFVALAAFTHPFGVVAVIVFTFNILGNSSIDVRERLKELSLLLFPVLVGAFLLGLWILQDMNGFIEQMSYQIARKDRPLFLTIVNTIKHYRNVPLALVLPVVSLGYVLPRAIRQRGKVRLLVLFLGVIMVVVISKFEIPYHVYIAPPGAVVTAMLLIELWKSNSRMRRRIAIVCIGGLLLNSALVFGYLNFVFHARLAGEANYNQFCKAVLNYIPAGAKLCGWGTPCVYWGFNEQRPDVGFIDKAFLDSLKANEVARWIDYVVLSRCFVPAEDEVGLKKQRDALSELCLMNGRELKAIATVGKKERYSYSAEVFQVVPLVDK
jgi:4-amino-4-deoxy-L-arabinose transferase-like glycosyltransferase